MINEEDFDDILSLVDDWLMRNSSLEVAEIIKMKEAVKKYWKARNN
jgi:hypothetical protein